MMDTLLTQARSLPGRAAPDHSQHPLGGPVPAVGPAPPPVPPGGPQPGAPHARPGWRLLARACTSAVVLAVLITVVVTAMGFAGRPAPARPRPGAQPLGLVPGSRIVAGVPTGYPYSLTGAVSAAVAYVSALGSTVQPSRAAEVARLIAAPSYRAVARQAGRQVTSTRRRMGLPRRGPVPAGQGVAVVPVMYQVRQMSPVRLTVLLLCDVTQTARGVVRERVEVTAAPLHWTAVSWRLLPSAPPGLSALLATPGTADAAAMGWKPMTGPSGRLR
jgi:hypothetical protein